MHGSLTNRKKNKCILQVQYNIKCCYLRRAGGESASSANIFAKSANIVNRSVLLWCAFVRAQRTLQLSNHKRFLDLSEQYHFCESRLANDFTLKGSFIRQPRPSLKIWQSNYPSCVSPIEAKSSRKKGGTLSNQVLVDVKVDKSNTAYLRMPTKRWQAHTGIHRSNVLFVTASLSQFLSLLVQP